MRPSASAIDQAIRGRTIIPVGKSGSFWSVYKRNQSFTGQQVYEFMLTRPGAYQPFEPQWLVDFSPPCPPLVMRSL
ncbi:MAG TPA: hypothetical protein VJM51_04470 [Dehalococcoidia bacterium]|nr:hypothetical protein [Dehalococcoidia bacterium]